MEIKKYDDVKYEVLHETEIANNLYLDVLRWQGWNMQEQILMQEQFKNAKWSIELFNIDDLFLEASVGLSPIFHDTLSALAVYQIQNLRDGKAIKPIVVEAPNLVIDGYHRIYALSCYGKKKVLGYKFRSSLSENQTTGEK